MAQDYKELREVSRTLIKGIFEDIQKGNKLDERSEKIGKVIRSHPEFNEFWANADKLSDEQAITNDGQNPFLHLYIHSAIEDQLKKNDPPIISIVAKKLEEKGISEHEATHKLGIAFTSELFDMMKNKRPFDRESYTEKLKELIK